MTLPVGPPWRLQGECLVALVRRSAIGREAGHQREASGDEAGAGARLGRSSRLPEGLQGLPGPRVVIAARYEHSPVGAYRELAVGQPARLGVRVGYCFTTMVVDSPDSRAGGRANWGFPKELGTLEWSRRGGGVELRWKERGVVVRGHVQRAVALPVLMPLPSLQSRSDGALFVPAHARGWARLAGVRIEVDDPADPLARLAGDHCGAHVGSLRLVVRPARRPAGTRSLRAPLRAPEPALSSDGNRGRLAQR